MQPVVLREQGAGEVFADLRSPETFIAALERCDPRLVHAALSFHDLIASLPPDPRFGIKPFGNAVGGFVRDALLGRDPKDFDYEVFGVAKDRLERLVREHFGARVSKVGEAFEILKVSLGGGLDIDISLPRRDSKVGPGHDGFEVEGVPNLGMMEAARRRDFTVNSLAANIRTGEIFDHFGGLADLKDRVLRVTDPEHFEEDPLRVYRGARFSSQLEFDLDKRAHAMLSRMVESGVLSELPRERVTGELTNILTKSPRPSLGFEVLREIGIIERYYPELHALIGVKQDEKWHPEGDVWIHEMMVLDAAAKKFRDSPHLLCGTLAGLLHDTGKPETTKWDNGHWRAHGHEEAGEAPSRKFFQRLSYSKEIIDQVIPCVTSHMAPVSLVQEFERQGLTEKQRVNAARRLLKRVHPASWDLFIGLCEADQRGRGFPDRETKPFESGEILTALINSNNLQNAAKSNLLQGRDLKALGMTPGPIFGEIISRIEALRDEGHLATTEEALGRVRAALARSNGQPFDPAELS